MRDGFRVYRRLMPVRLTDAVLRLVNRDLLLRGADAEEFAEWQRVSCWFPHLRESPEVETLRAALPALLREGVACEPQILLHFPAEAYAPAPLLTPHVDEPPPWADGRGYARIVGVPLTRWRKESGSVVFWQANETLVSPPLDPGDVVVFGPDTRHSPGVNISPGIRYGVYYRFLAPHA